jgi:hypothetical protein
LPSRAGEVEDLIVYFLAMGHSGFRKAQRLEHNLRFLERLRSLTVPISFIPGLDPDALPSSLRRIAVAGDGRASFLKGGAFPGVQALDAWPTLSTPNTEVKFEPVAFPALQEVACRLDARGALLDVISTYPRLASLRTGPIKDPGVFPRLASVAIEFLSLQRGSLASLEGIQNVRGMRYLELKNMNRLADITALESCKDLEVLAIHYCANLRDHEPLLKIPRLRSVFLFRCNALDPAACALALASRPALRMRIWSYGGSRRTPKG